MRSLRVGIPSKSALFLGTKMSAILSVYFTYYFGTFVTIATACVAVGIFALGVWCGFRLAAKLMNRGVGQ